MGMSPLIITGTMGYEDGEFITDYEQRRFLGGYAVFCKYCSPQRRPPSAGEIDIADGTLRIEKSPDDVEHLTQFSDSLDVAVESEGTSPVFQYTHDFRVRNPAEYGEYEAIIHIVLPEHCLPRLDSVQPPPQYGWRKQTRYVLGWLTGFVQLEYRDAVPVIGLRRFKFEAIAQAQFNGQARQLSQEIRALAETQQRQMGSLALLDTMPNLTGYGYQSIHDALVSAFDFDALSRMVRIELERDLEWIATRGANFLKAVDDLIRWAEREDRIGDLIEGAYNQNDTNRSVGALRDAYRAHPQTFVNQ
jgi:hypothetical protein